MTKASKGADRPVLLEYIALGELVPFARNARSHNEMQVAQIAQSISEFGFTNPVLISSDNSIIAGHGRVMAARLLGMADVPCFGSAPGRGVIPTVARAEWSPAQLR
jgi:ParB-like chromosome segregation protein Spo0J